MPPVPVVEGVVEAVSRARDDDESARHASTTSRDPTEGFIDRSKRSSRRACTVARIDLGWVDTLVRFDRARSIDRVIPSRPARPKCMLIKGSTPKASRDSPAASCPPPHTAAARQCRGSGRSRELARSPDLVLARRPPSKGRTCCCCRHASPGQGFPMLGARSAFLEPRRVGSEYARIRSRSSTL